MEVEWLILADAAQVVGNKLYLMGGGWDRITVNKEPPVPHSMAVAVSFRVAWNETNQRHSFQIEVATGDGQSIGRVDGHFEVGRPAGLPPGQDQRTQIAVNVNWRINQLGTYVVVARIDGQEGRRFPFNVVAGPSLASQQRREEGPKPEGSD
jgi:hypothetical protein